MKTALFVLVIALAASLSSCSSKVKEERLTRIDSLGIHLNHVQDVLKSVDSVALENWSSEISRNEVWVWDNLTDTLEPQPGIIAGDYFRTKKFTGKVLGRYGQVKKEVGYAQTQLATLREDVKNSFYSEEEFHAFFNAEAEAMDKLVKAGDELESASGSVFERYKLIKPRFEHILDSIKTHIYGDKPAL